MEPAGYSGRPLAKKLGIKSGFTARLINPPDYYLELFTDLPDDISFEASTDIKKDFIHFFTLDSGELSKVFSEIKDEIKSNGMIWVSWPKKSSRIQTDIDGNIVRKTGLDNGLVDVKVCAVDQTWSGLKFMIRVKDR